MTQTTIDLGKIKFNWRGTYDATASYVKDDVVEYGGSAWVATNSITASAPQTPHPAWDLMALGGDPASTMTSQGDLLVKGALGLERLSLGSAGQVLKVNSAGNGLEYGVSVPSGTEVLVQRSYQQYRGGGWTNSTTMSWVPGLHYNFTPLHSNSRLKFIVGFHARRALASDLICELNIGISNTDGTGLIYQEERFQNSNHSTTYQNTWAHYELEVKRNYNQTWGTDAKRIGILTAAHNAANYKALFHQTTWSNYTQAGVGSNAYPYWIMEEYLTLT